MNKIANELIKIANEISSVNKSYSQKLLQEVNKKSYIDYDEQSSKWCAKQLLQIYNFLKPLAESYGLFLDSFKPYSNVSGNACGYYFNINMLLDNDQWDGEKLTDVNAWLQMEIDGEEDNIRFNTFEQFSNKIQDIIKRLMLPKMFGFYKVTNIYSNYIYVKVQTLSNYVVEQLKSKLKDFIRCDGVRSAVIDNVDVQKGEYENRYYVSLKVGVLPKSYYNSTQDMVDMCLDSINQCLAEINIEYYG